MVLVTTQQEVRRRGENAFEGGKFFGNEGRDALQGSTPHDDQQIVTARYEHAGVHFIEPADPLSQTIEPTFPLRCDAHLNDRLDCGFGGGFPGKIEHWTPAEEDFIFFQLLQVLFHFGLRQTRDLRHLRGRETSTFE